MQPSFIKNFSYLPKEDLDLIKRARAKAELAHAGQVRLSGEPYVTHPEAVALLLGELKLDAATIAAALLHDTLEDTELTEEELLASFGEEVTTLVQGVTKLKKLHLSTREQRQAENLRKMLVAMAQDLRVVLIKLADRLHNMRTLSFHTKERQIQISHETLDVYAPLAHRLGLQNFKSELQNLAFSYLEPEIYQSLKVSLEEHHLEREENLKKTIESLKNSFKDAGIEATFLGREKHLYSVQQKLISQGKTLEEVYDLLAIRILVEGISDCYAALGLVHALYRPLPGRFKDYLATPKENGYQSLHTTVLTPVPIEIQIRTHEMHQFAEYGVAAHWRYKEKGPIAPKERLAWLSLLQQWQSDMLDAEAFVTTVQSDLFQTEVFVFTPKGAVHSLPAGSTPVDFAYRVHTDVGHRTLGAKINGRIVPLNHPLENGDIVEILTQKGKKSPSRDWLTFVKTATAREKIRSYLKKERREENVGKGRELLEKELHRLGKTLSKEEDLLPLAKESKYPLLADFYAAIGYGELSAKGLALRVVSETPSALPPIPITSAKVDTRAEILGMDSTLTNVAPCCTPVAGDQIKGFITRGKGITVHRKNCPNLNGADPTRLLDLKWNTGRLQNYPVKLTIEGENRTGLLHECTAIIAEAKIPLTFVEARSGEDQTAWINASIEIPNLTALSQLLEKLSEVAGVESVRRVG